MWHQANCNICYLLAVTGNESMKFYVPISLIICSYRNDCDNNYLIIFNAAICYYY